MIVQKSSRVLIALASAAALAACSGFAGGSAPTTLPAGLSAPMDQQGAQLDRNAALNLLNAYRSSVGAPALQADPALDAQAQTLASQYAASGRAPSAPAGVRAIKLSAGYSNFAETFSGWRNSSADARVLADPGARRAGLAVAYSGTSTYGTHWVLLLAN
ncbi:hypothetical protein GCM10007989_22480 [Devosia pacifica]|uniref:SCP domain-containing protein n=1 Tax=Devosia pacifica TaxID=1335967 RepID=A0A918S5Y8_9HYPH|nr:CAP domain-containing protein [Devosia pacifica]GHA26221.1 hypothetical protein GCM10007989_22480 [Devosia pacifica]